MFFCYDYLSFPSLVIHDHVPASVCTNAAENWHNGMHNQFPINDSPLTVRRREKFGVEYLVDDCNISLVIRNKSFLCFGYGVFRSQVHMTVECNDSFLQPLKHRKLSKEVRYFWRPSHIKRRNDIQHLHVIQQDFNKDRICLVLSCALNRSFDQKDDNYDHDDHDANDAYCVYGFIGTFGAPVGTCSIVLWLAAST